MSSPNIQHYIGAEKSSRIHQFVYWLDFIKQFKSNANLEGAFVGSYSLTAPRIGVTYVANHHMWCGEPVSAASVARRILTQGLKMLRRKRIPWNKQALPLLTIPHPLYCQPQTTPQRMWYVDVKATYFNIYSRMPFDFWFDGNYSISGELQFADFLPTNLSKYKLCRNSLVGVLRCTQSSRLKGGSIVSGDCRNSLLSPYHWGFIAHLLHWMAHQAIQCNAIYYNTDGAIFLSEEDAANWAIRIADLGFETNVKHAGYGIVWGVGRYKISNDRIGVQHAPCEPTNNLITPSDKLITDWLKMI